MKRFAWVMTTALAACGGGASDCPPVTPSALPPATLGGVTGEVRFAGLEPPREPREMTSAECAHGHAGPWLDEALLTTDGKLENALVYISEGLGSLVFAPPTTTITLDQQGCVFLPRVVAAQVCQPVRFLNSDRFLHNVHGESLHNPDFNLALSAAGVEKIRQFKRSEVAIAIKCDVHPWMKSHLAVFGHPYFAVTGRDGSFSLTGIPAGDYTLTAWHERLGTVSSKLTIVAGGNQNIAISLPAGP